jgi:hypothetical protein
MQLSILAWLAGAWGGRQAVITASGRLHCCGTYVRAKHIRVYSYSNEWLATTAKLHHSNSSIAPCIPLCVQTVELEDIKFHQCVRLARFENDRTISFVPPDGNFDLMSYRLSQVSHCGLQPA